MKLQHVDAKITRPRSRFDRSTGLRGFRSRDGKGEEGTIAGKIAAIKLRLTSSLLPPCMVNTKDSKWSFDLETVAGEARRTKLSAMKGINRETTPTFRKSAKRKRYWQQERERIKRISVLGRSFEAASFLDEEAFCAIHSVSREGQLIVEDKGREGNGWIIIETCGGFVADLFETRSRYIQG